MCEPTTLAMISTGMSVMGANQQAKAQEAQYQANLEASLQAQADEQRMINLQQSQEQEKAAQEKIANDLQVKQTASRVQATDTGAIINNNAVMQDIVRQGLEANTGISQNLERSDAQAREEMRGAKSRAQSRINSVSRPSKAATGLAIGSALVSGAQDYRKAGGTFGL